MKTCACCKLSLDPSNFNKESSRPDGLSPYCKPCRKDKASRNYEKNKDRILARNKEWQKANPDAKNAIARKRRAENPYSCIAYQRAWREKNPEKAREYAKKWRSKVGPERVNGDAAKYREENRASTRAAALKWQKENPGKANAANAARYAAKMRATPKWADLDAIELIYLEAERMSRETGVKHEVDHIVPLRSKIVSGLHCESNLRVMPAFDNRSKGNRHWPDMP